MAGTETKTSEKTALDVPWNVVVYDDPVNLMDYVTRVFMKIFGYPEQRAKTLMMEVHTQGRSLVWSGEREVAEHHVHRLHAFQLYATLEKAQG